MSKHLSADSCAYFRGLPNWQEHMSPILTEADKHGLIVDVHVLTLGTGEEQDQQRETICSLVRECVETAFGRPGALSASDFVSARFVITLSQGGDVVGVILGDYQDYLFTLSFECVAEAMRRKGLGALLYKASDTVIQCLCRDMTGTLPTTNDILVVAYTEPEAPVWVREFMPKVGFAMAERYVPAEDDEDLYQYNWGGGYVHYDLDTWDKRLAY